MNNTTVPPEDTAHSSHATSLPPIKVTGEQETRSPDELMAAINQSIITKGMVISAVIHLLVIALTSFSLYADWAKYGLMLPYEIKAEKKALATAARKEQMAAERKKKEEKRLATIAAKEAAEKPSKGPADQTAENGESTATDTRSEYQKDVEQVLTDKPQAPSRDLDTDLGLEE